MAHDRVCSLGSSVTGGVSPSSSPISTKSTTNNGISKKENQNIDPIEIATFMVSAAHPATATSPTAVTVKAEPQDAEVDDQLQNGVTDDSRVITGYNLQAAIKTVSSITLMRRIQSHSPQRNRNGLNSRGFPRSSSVSSVGGTSVASSKASKMAAGGKEKKRRVAQVSSLPGECIWCGTHKTAQWRRGPIGARSLCNVSLHQFIPPLSLLKPLLFTWMCSGVE